MHDDQLDSIIRDAARSYNEPPAADADAMWAAIEREHFDHVAPRNKWYAASWIRLAAALILGVGLGRFTLLPSQPQVRTPAAASLAVLPRVQGAYDALPALNAADASQYLGQTVALLASLQSDTRSSSTDKQMVEGAADLLNTTRFLLDAPTTTDPNVRGLLEDLELVLAQVVQLPRTQSTTDVELIHQAMAERDVMPRLRTAVANNYSAE